MDQLNFPTLSFKPALIFLMGCSRIFNWGGPRIDKVRNDGQHVAKSLLKYWPIGGEGAWAPAPLEPPLIFQYLQTVWSLTTPSKRSPLRNIHTMAHMIPRLFDTFSSYALKMLTTG